LHDRIAAEEIFPETRKKRAPRTLGPEKTEKIFAALAHDRPDPKTELEYSNPFTLVVAVALSAQATDVGVNKATRKLFTLADTPEKMLALGEEGVADHIKTIGLWRNKAKNVIALSQKLLDDFGGEVPRTREDLTTLPGVGRKTANVVMNEVFGEPTIAVDTHIFRVSNRTGLAPGKTPDEVEAVLERVTPAEVEEGRASLVDPARSVCLQGSDAGMLAMRYCAMVQVHAENARPSDGFLVGAKSAEIEDQIDFGAQVPATPAKAFLVDAIHPATEVSDGFIFKCVFAAGCDGSRGGEAARIAGLQFALFSLILRHAEQEKRAKE
jgi:endonuclease-3